MKKTVLIILVAVTFGFASCKKCATCQVTNYNGFSTYPEDYCGTSAEVKNFEDSYNQKAAALLQQGGQYIGVVANCHQKD
ncbi:MAG: hypothetical protein NTW49_12090 [Bacteroidia bacterium]|nr:hypothetical protein [Bacteroidia bacterium]